MKRLGIILLCVMGVLFAQAEEQTVLINGLWYRVLPENGVAAVIRKPQIPHVNIISKKPLKGKLVIPTTIMFYPDMLNESSAVECAVIGIEAEAFMGWDKITEVELPQYLLYIGPKAFAECKSLKRIDIPASVENIGDYAFAYCKKLRHVRFANSLGANAGHKTWFVGTKAHIESVLLPGESVSIY